MQKIKIAVVIPCFKVRRHIEGVLAAIVPAIYSVYVIDDCCPERTGDFVKGVCRDPRIKVIHHSVNQGVGGAMATGYRQALEDGMDIVIKVDGDGQMDLRLIEKFVEPILYGSADYTKGNRFFSPEFLKNMPRVRLFGNAILSFISKASTGYWNLMDPTNGFTAIHRCALANIPLDQLDKGYFFETDMLFRLNTIRAVVQDVPMESLYKDEKSNLSITRIVRDFPLKHLTRLVKRILYSYFLRDFNVCSSELIIGTVLTTFGVCFGLVRWADSFQTGVANPVGTVMLAAIPLILGVQFLLAAVNYDAMNIPKESLQKLLDRRLPLAYGPNRPLSALTSPPTQAGREDSVGAA